MKKIDWIKELKTFLQVLAGTLLIGVGIMYFINPSGLYTGGVTGLSQLIVNIALQISGGSVQINLGFLVFLFQIPLVILGYLRLSRRFILYSLISVLISSGFLALPITFSVMGDDILAAALAGGVLIGFGNGILYQVGASSGGTAILFQVLSKKTGKSVGIYQIILHGIIILIAGIQFSLMTAVYTIVAQGISALVVDKVHTGYHFLKLEIVTDLGEAMTVAIAKQMPHGATAFEGVGGYSGKPHKVVFVVVSGHELPQYLALVESIDPKAFVAVSGVASVHGNFQKKNII